MYEIEFTRKAENQLCKLEQTVQKRIIAVLERSRIRPEAHFKKLVGDEGYRLKVGDYRVIADISRKKLTILVIKLGHRRNIYKR